MAARLPIACAGRFAASLRSPQASLRSPYRPQRPFRGRQFAVLSALRAKRYSEDHEWVELSEDKKIVTLGVSSYAAAALGDVIYVELPQVELDATAGEPVGAVESVKSANDIITPVSGKVIETNSTLETKPGLLNKDPEGAGWVAKLEVGGDIEATMDVLMDDAAYKKFTQEAESES